MSNPCQFDESGNHCPRHPRSAVKKTYTFGSSMSAETEVVVFDRCRCAVAIRHDPIGQYPASATIHDSYGDATGYAVLHRDMAAAKYR